MTSYTPLFSPRRGIFILILSGFAAVTCAGTAQAATRVDLVIDEGIGQPERKVPWPVTTGVPFPRGALKTVENCRLVEDGAQERPLQARVAATWDAERTSIRWLMIDFIAQPGRKYALEFGPDVQARPAPSRLRVDAGQPVRVTTGVLAAEFHTTGPSSLGRILCDLNGDGALQPDEEVAAGADGGEHYAIDQEGRRASSAGDGKDRRVIVEASGPVRACIRLDGFYTGPDGRRLLAYRTRYHFFAELGLIKVVDEFRVIGSTRGVRWQDVGFSLRRPGGLSGQTVALAASADPGAAVVSIQPDKESQAVASFQSTYRHYGNQESIAGIVEERTGGAKRHKDMDRAGAWMQVADPRAAITGSLRWFWQQFPKEWEATPGGLTLHLWSKRGGDLDFSADGIKRFFGDAGQKYLLNWEGIRSPLGPIEHFFFFAGRAALERGQADGLGLCKHHEFTLHFAPGGKTVEGQEYGRLAAEPPAVLASGAWNCGTDVFGPLASRPSNSPDEAIVDRLFDLSRYAQDAFGDYGWWLFGAGPHYSYQWDAGTKRHYADPRRFEHHTYQKETQLWWNYFRSGERKFLDWALPSENHWVDVAVAHEPTMFQSEWRGGEKAPALLQLHWPRGDWAIDSTAHYVRHHDTGEAWLRGQSQFWATYHRTLETTTLAYYLTGDERFNDVIGYWRDYWGELAGKTSASPDFKPWHREQAWYRPTAAGERPKTWAEMLRDYAPFNSGSRHQLTLLFNLSTLYEHTWDPQVGQALREYAAAFLDPAHPIGVWRSYDNRGPAHAEAPIMSHYWSSALWKYARATGDPRMPDIFRRYYDACLGADPFHEDVGIYSNVQIGYGYYLTRDPRHLQPALLELDELRPYAAPLARPEDLGLRIYNPYAAIRSFTGVPRLLWALQDAARSGVAVPPPAPTRPQRAPIALEKPAGVALHATLWGFDKSPALSGPDGKPFSGAALKTQPYVSAIQPFDRTLPDFAVYRHELTIPADAPAGPYILTPRLEIAVLSLTGSDGVRCQATTPLELEAHHPWFWKVPAATAGNAPIELRLESASPQSIRVVGVDETLSTSVTPGALIVPLPGGRAGQILRFENTTAEAAWFRIAGQPAGQCWVGTTAAAALRPEVAASLAANATSPTVSFRPDDVYVAGRFGKGLLVRPGRALHLPDHYMADGKAVRLFDTEQGTIEFWIKRLWDDRLVTVPRFSFLTNGPVETWVPWKLPVDEWAHVAVSWRPLPKAPDQTLVHVYVDGLDQGNYRNLYWDGYGDRPRTFFRTAKWLEELVSRAPPGAAFVLDELRVSTVPRYADLNADLGSRLAINPHRFTPPAAAFPTNEADKATTLLFHFDDDLKDAARKSPLPLEGRLSDK